MWFNQLILKKTHSLFREYGFEITENFKNIVRYETKVLYVIFAHNDRENSNSFWIGSKITSITIEVINLVISEVFDSNIEINNLSTEKFIKNIVLFLTNEGKPLLEENEFILRKLENFDQNRSEAYTTKIIEEQYLKAANKAWKESNYSDVIRYLDKVNKDMLPLSYKQKYKISQRKLSCWSLC